MKLVNQSFILILSLALLAVWKYTPLINFTVPLLGILIASYLLLSMRKHGKGFLTMGGDGPYGIFILNTLVLLLVFLTGSLSSPLFFLLYFLGFGIAFVFEPAATFVMAIGAILIFMPEALGNETIINLVKLGSLLLISPLAFFFGAQYRETDKQSEKITGMKERTKEAADTISDDIEEIISDDKESLKEKDLQKLNEVLEETEDLREESKI